MTRALDRYADRITLDQQTGCMVWHGAANGSTPVVGIGGRKGKVVNLRTLVYEDEWGPLDDGLSVVCTCGNMRCVAPDHLTLASTPDARCSRAAEKKRAATHCKHGHLLTGHNLIIRKDGTRKCRACKNETKRRATAARRQP